MKNITREMVVVVLIRHGEASHNVRSEYTLRQHKDAQLTERGRRQCARLKQRIAHLRVTRVVSSPLLRARQTAQLLFGDMNVNVMIDARERFIKNHVCNLMIGEFDTEKHETDDEIEARANSVLSYIKHHCSDTDTVAVTTHGNFIRACAKVLGLKREDDSWVGHAEFIVTTL